jgi:hypothetical protein
MITLLAFSAFLAFLVFLAFLAFLSLSEAKVCTLFRSLSIGSELMLT